MSRVRLKNFLRRFAVYHYVIEVKLKAFYERHRAKFIPVDPKQDQLFKEQQQNDPNGVFKRSLEEMCRLAIKESAKPLLVYVPTSDELGTTNSSDVLRVKRGLSEELKVPLVDMTPALEADGKALYLEGDSVHLNSRGNEIVARRLFEAVTNTAVVP